jgi:hypothetical protein
MPRGHVEGRVRKLAFCRKTQPMLLGLVSRVFFKIRKMLMPAGKRPERQHDRGGLSFLSSSEVSETPLVKRSVANCARDLRCQMLRDHAIAFRRQMLPVRLVG